MRKPLLSKIPIVVLALMFIHEVPAAILPAQVNPKWFPYEQPISFVFSGQGFVDGMTVQAFGEQSYSFDAASGKYNVSIGPIQRINGGWRYLDVTPMTVIAYQPYTEDFYRGTLVLTNDNVFAADVLAVPSGSVGEVKAFASSGSGSSIAASGRKISRLYPDVGTFFVGTIDSTPGLEPVVAWYTQTPPLPGIQGTYMVLGSENFTNLSYKLDQDGYLELDANGYPIILEDDGLTAKAYYPKGLDEDTIRIHFYDYYNGMWRDVEDEMPNEWYLRGPRVETLIKNRTDSLDGTTSGGRFTFRIGRDTVPHLQHTMLPLVIGFTGQPNTNLAVQSLSPSSATAGSGPVTLLVRGENFTADCQIKYGGSTIPTSFVPEDRTLQANINLPANVADITPVIVTVVRGSDLKETDPIAFIIKPNAVTKVSSVVAEPGLEATVQELPKAPDQSESGIAATLVNPENGGNATVSVASYSTQPNGTSFVVDGSGTPMSAVGQFMDLQVTGVTDDAAMQAFFYYARPAANIIESSIKLVFWTGAAWAEVKSGGPNGPAEPIQDITDNLDGTTSAGRFTIVFDRNSVPKISELAGTIIASAAEKTDFIPPTLSCSGDIVVPPSLNPLISVVYQAPNATDNTDPHPKINCLPSSGAQFPLGVTVVTCTATDASGNGASCSFNVNRLPLTFSGFLPPVGGADSTGGNYQKPLQTFKMNSTIPLKFTLSNGNAAVTTGTHRLQAIKYSSETVSGTPIDVVPQGGATAGNQFQWASDHWHFNLDTKATGLSVGIWQLIATLADGTQHRVWIQIK